MKDPIEVLLPSGNRIFVVLRAEESRGRMPFALLDDLPLDLGHSSGVKASGEWVTRRVYCLLLLIQLTWSVFRWPQVRTG